MAPRSAARLVKATATKTPVRRKKSTRKKAVPAGAMFYCYRVTDHFTLLFYATREEALVKQRELRETGSESEVQRVTVKSNDDLAKLLRDHTV